MGKVKIYADENVEKFIVEYLRDERFSIDSALELGFASRDDEFHLQEAKKRKRRTRAN